jgi:hypothetical protein
VLFIDEVSLSLFLLCMAVVVRACGCGVWLKQAGSHAGHRVFLVPEPRPRVDHRAHRHPRHQPWYLHRPVRFSLSIFISISSTAICILSLSFSLCSLIEFTPSFSPPFLFLCLSPCGVMVFH